jgi:hypothetical protein
MSSSGFSKTKSITSILSMQREKKEKNRQATIDQANLFLNSSKKDTKQNEKAERELNIVKRLGSLIKT